MPNPKVGPLTQRPPTYIIACTQTNTIPTPQVQHPTPPLSFAPHGTTPLLNQCYILIPIPVPVPNKHTTTITTPKFEIENLLFELALQLAPKIRNDNLPTLLPPQK